MIDAAEQERQRRLGMEMIKSFTDTASKLTGIAESSFVIYLRESSHDNVGVGGELLEDKFKEK